MPFVLKRVARVRGELISLANVLEFAHHASPGSVAIVERLLRDGTSPLYDERTPESQLTSTLRAARTGLVTSAHAVPQTVGHQSSLT